MRTGGVTFGLIAVDVIWIVGISVAVGAWAPHWPDSWLSRDRFPVCRLPGESVEGYRRLGVRRLAHLLPEGGAIFGGESKTHLRGSGREDLTDYLVEVRRAEWVHVWSIVASLALFAFNLWWVALALVLAVVAGNLPFLLVLRQNRLRISRIVDRRSAVA